MNSWKKWEFPVLKAARWATPVLDSEGQPTDQVFEDWVLWISADNLPLDLPLDPNARYPDIKKPTPKAIRRTLLEEPAAFVKRNNGICMVAQVCHVRNGIATIHLNSFTSEEEHDEGRRGDGILNGGHTYAVIKEVLSFDKNALQVENAPDPGSAIVRVEILTGLIEEDLADISRARNKSEPVEEYSLKNLGNAWQDIKSILPKDIRGRVRFMENDPEAPEANFDVGDLVKLLALFNNKVYPAGKKDPLSAYSSEKRLIANWDASEFKHLLPHLLTFIKLHDEVTLLFPNFMGSMPGKVNGVISYVNKEPWEMLSGKKSRYYIPPPFTFPVLAALRVFLADDGSKWYVEPEKLIKNEAYVKDLIKETWNEYKRSGRSSAAFFGRNRQVWRMLALMMMVKLQSVLRP